MAAVPVPVQQNTTIDQWSDPAAAPPGNINTHDGAEEVCKAVLRAIQGSAFMQPYVPDLGVAYNRASGFGKDLDDAKNLIKKCVEILKRISQKPSMNDFDAADDGLISYIETNLSSLADPAQKKLIFDTVVNLFKNQLYLLAFLICKEAHGKALAHAQSHGNANAAEIGSARDFITKILGKLTAVNTLNQDFYANLLTAQSVQAPQGAPAAMAFVQPGGGLAFRNQLLHKCLYKAHKHQYMLSKLYNKN